MPWRRAVLLALRAGGHIGDADTLVALATAAGLDADAARDALDSEELDRAVEDDIALAARLGIRGVPFFVVDSRYGVSGAQPSEVFLDVLGTVLSEQAPSLITVEGGQGRPAGPRAADPPPVSPVNASRVLLPNPGVCVTIWESVYPMVRNTTRRFRRDIHDFGRHPRDRHHHEWCLGPDGVPAASGPLDPRDPGGGWRRAP
nr:DsbA family protein [Tessaracoccus coleopterorum]